MIRPRRSLLLVLALAALVAGAVVVAHRAPDEDFRLFGSREPRAPGDTAALCVVDVTRPDHWVLGSRVQRVRVLPDGRRLIWTTHDARTACGPMLWEHGARTDTLPVRDIQWRITPDTGDPVPRSAWRRT